jgi:hypothetical protein
MHINIMHYEKKNWCKIRRSLFGHWHQLALHDTWTVKESTERDVHYGSAVSRVLWSLGR